MRWAYYEVYSDECSVYSAGMSDDVDAAVSSVGYAANECRAVVTVAVSVG